MATFRDLLDDTSNTFNDENPFYFIEKWGDTRWDDGDRLVLEDEDSPFREASGRLYLIVKAEWEVRLRIRTKNWRSFNQDDYTVDTRQAYNMTFDNALIGSPNAYKSSMTVTLRGGSMLAIAVDGDKGVWHTTGSDFSNEAKTRTVPQPQFQLSYRGDKYTANGMLLSLSAPYGDYSSTRVRNWTYNRFNADTRVDLVSYNLAPALADGTPQAIVPTSGDVVSEQVPQYLEPSGWSTPLVIDSGVDVNGDSWSVELRLNNDDDKWYIVVDGNVNDELSYSDADDMGYQNALSQARLVADARREQAKVKDQDKNKDFAPTITSLGLGIGVGVIALGLLVVFIATRR